MSNVCYVIAVVLFVLAGFGAHALGLSSHELAYFGLAFFATGHLPLP